MEWFTDGGHYAQKVVKENFKWPKENKVQENSINTILFHLKVSFQIIE